MAANGEVRLEERPHVPLTPHRYRKPTCRTAGTYFLRGCLLKRVVSKRKLAAVSVVVAMLGCIGCGRKSVPETALILDIATAPQSCGDGRSIVAIALGSGRAKLNGEAAVPLVQLAARIRDVQSYRAEKLLYVTAEAGVQWGDFVAMIERVWPEADVVSIVTPQVERLARQRYRLAPSCGRCGGFRSKL
jgi:hypothetical protein